MWNVIPIILNYFLTIHSTFCFYYFVLIKEIIEYTSSLTVAHIILSDMFRTVFLKQKIILFKRNKFSWLALSLSFLYVNVSQFLCKQLECDLQSHLHQQDVLLGKKWLDHPGASWLIPVPLPARTKKIWLILYSRKHESAMDSSVLRASNWHLDSHGFDTYWGLGNSFSKLFDLRVLLLPSSFSLY